MHKYLQTCEHFIFLEIEISFYNSISMLANQATFVWNELVVKLCNSYMVTVHRQNVSTSKLKNAIDKKTGGDFYNFYCEFGGVGM